MHDWNAEGDFFADGSRGQRIYVNPRAHLVIVQLANESAQDFPFRKIAHALMGEPFRYPTSIPARLLAAARGGAGPDSLRALYRSLTERERAHPQDFVVTEAGMISVGRTLVADPHHRITGIAVLELAVERAPTSYQAHEALGEALERADSKQRALVEYRQAVQLAPDLAHTASKRLSELHFR